MTHRARARFAWLALSLAAACAGAPARAAPPAAGYAASAAGQAHPLTQVQRLERRFLQLAAGNLRFAGDASRLALARSGNPAVKDLANLVLAHQQKVQPELLRLLHARGMAPPLMTGEHGKVLKQLARFNGGKLDRLYVEEAVLRPVQADIANYERLATEAEDPVMKAWIERHLPALRMLAAQASRTLPAAPALRGHRAA